MQTLKRILAGTAVVAMLGGCATYDPYQDPYFHTKAGAVLGAVGGGVLGHQFDDEDGRYFGAAAGAVAGGALGQYIDRNHQTTGRYYQGTGYGYNSSQYSYGGQYGQPSGYYGNQYGQSPQYSTSGYTIPTY